MSAQLSPLGSSLIFRGMALSTYSTCPGEPTSSAHAPFPSWREQHSFLLHKELSVSGNLSFIPPLPAPLAVQPAEHAEVQIQPGMQSCLEGIFKQYVAKSWQWDWQESGFLSWSSGTSWCMHTEARRTVGRPAALSPHRGHHIYCMWCWRKKPSADTSFQEACCHCNKEFKQQCFCRADACHPADRKVCLMVAFVFKHEAKALAWLHSELRHSTGLHQTYPTVKNSVYSRKNTWKEKTKANQQTSGQVLILNCKKETGRNAVKMQF